MSASLMRWLAWLSATFALTALVLSGYALRVAMAVPPEVIAQRPQPHLFAAPTPSPAFFANERQHGHFHVIDPLYGAVGDNSHDDTAAFNAASADASNFPRANAGGGTIHLDNPSIAYRITSPITITWRAHWKGEAVNFGSGIIRASTSMPEMIVLHTGQGSPAPEGAGAMRAVLEDLTLDCNSLANYGILAIDSEHSELHNVTYLNCPGPGFREANLQGVTVGAVTPTVPGGSPSGVTISQLDQNYSGIAVLGAPGVYPLSIKVLAPGALDTATFVYNINGAGYSTVGQPISAISFPAIEYPVGVPTLIYSSGLKVNFPTGSYFAGDHWDTTLTTVSGDYGQSVASSPGLKFYNSVADSCGTTYATGPLVNTFGAVVTPGTLTLTAGSDTFTGVGTQFTQLFGAGKAMLGLYVATSPDPVTLQVAAVLSDSQLVVSSGQENLIPTASGLNFAIGGASHFQEDGLSESGDQYFEGGLSYGGAVDMMFNSAYGPVLYKHEFWSAAILGATFGYSALGAKSSKIDNCICDSGVRTCWYFGQGSDGKWEGPRHIKGNFVGLPNGWFFNGGSSFGGMSTATSQWITSASEMMQAGLQVSITSHATVLPLPSLSINNPSPYTSFMRITSNSDVTLDSTPVLANPVDPFTGAFIGGLKLVIQNVGLTTITIGDHQIYSSGISLGAPQVAIGPGDILTLHSDRARTGNHWYLRSLEHSYGQARGNLGAGSNRVVTIDATPTAIYQNIDVKNVDIASGTYIRFTIQGNARNGLDWAVFEGYYASDANGSASPGLVKTLSIGSNAGSPPAGWNVTASLAAPFAAINVTGDNSGNSVAWVMSAQHTDGSTLSVAGGLRGHAPWALVPLAAFWLRRRRAENDTERKKRAA